MQTAPAGPSISGAAMVALSEAMHGAGHPVWLGLFGIAIADIFIVARRKLAAAADSVDRKPELGWGDLILWAVTLLLYGLGPLNGLSASWGISALFIGFGILL